MTYKEILSRWRNIKEQSNRLQKETCTLILTKLKSLLSGTKSNSLSFGQWGTDTGGTDGSSVTVHPKDEYAAAGEATGLKLVKIQGCDEETFIVEVSMENRYESVSASSLPTDEAIDILKILLAIGEDTKEDGDWTVNEDGEVSYKD